MAIELIAHTEVGSGGVSNIDFTSIPGTYDDLLLIVSAQGQDTTSVAMTMLVQFNSDTATNYSETGVRGIQRSASSYRTTNFASLNFTQVEAFASGTNYPFGSAQMYLPNYSGTTNYKQVLVDDAGGRLRGVGDNYTSLRAGLWRSTSAISSIRVGRLAFTYKLAQYSTATLYGITKA